MPIPIPKKYRTPLVWACMQGREDTVKLLLEAGADHHKTDRHGCSPLHAAAHLGQKEVVLLVLLDRGADINKATDLGDTPLHAAAHMERREVVQILLDRGADPCKKDKNGRTPACVYNIQY